MPFDLPQIENEHGRPHDFDPAPAAPPFPPSAGPDTGEARPLTYDSAFGPAQNILNALLAGLGGATFGGAINAGSTLGGAGLSIRHPQQQQPPQQQAQQMVQRSAPEQQQGSNGMPIRPSYSTTSSSSSQRQIPPSASSSSQGSMRSGSASIGPVNVQWRLSRAPSSSSTSSQQHQQNNGASTPLSPPSAGYGEALRSQTDSPSLQQPTRRRASSDTNATTPMNEWRPLNGGPPGVEARGIGEVPTLSS